MEKRTRITSGRLTAIGAVIGIVMPIVYVVVFCVVSYFLVGLISDFYWGYQEHYVVRQIEKYQFPSAEILDTKVDISPGQTLYWCRVTAYVTFETTSSFEEVQQWYRFHPKGIVYAEGGHGLDLLDQQVDKGTIEYGVRYQKWISTFLCPESD